ncbi:DUF1801 domain-containing protein [Candidatus Saccharibacteria bacterium]|nr:DUF1801 domain-containing protein [Candidatus Saccharibacteria bacterium]
MPRMMKQYKTVDEYIESFPEPVQAKLQKMREAIAAEAPEAREKIAYGIPTFTFHGNLVHYAAYDTHFGFYPAASGVEAFKDELKDYETSKGTIRFPLDKPLPLDLIRRITAFRVQQNMPKQR